MSEAITTALQGVATNATGAITSIAPVGITVMGSFLVWKLGIKFFKGVAK